MAVSAFGPQGRLKKHALRGTALGQDPSRGATRSRFRELYDEARGGNFNRSQMQERLSGRAQGAVDQASGRLSELAGQRQSLSQEQTGLTDPNRQRMFAMYQGGVMDKEFQSERGASWMESRDPEFRESADTRLDFLMKDVSQSDREMMLSDPSKDPSTTAGMNKDRLANKRITEANIAARERYGRLQAASQTEDFRGYGRGEFNGMGGDMVSVKQKAGTQRAFGDWMNQKTAKARQGFVSEQWEGAYGATAFGQNQARIRKATTRIQGAQGRLARTQGETRQRLQSRAELYNMFLGQ